MRIQVLSDHGGEQFDRTVQQLHDVELDIGRWRQSIRHLKGDLKARRRAKSWWRRLLRISTAEERKASLRLYQARMELEAATGRHRYIDGRAHQQAAGRSGEDELARGLAALDDSWVMLRGYRNRRGETDMVLVGPGGVWAVEVKLRRVRLHVRGEQWWYEKLDAYGNVVETGSAVDGGGRSWARQVTDVADDLAAWLGRNGHPVPVRTAVMVMHERAAIGSCDQVTVHVVGTHPAHLLRAIDQFATPLDPGAREEIVALIQRDHRFHNQRRGGSGGRHRDRRSG